MAMNDSAAQRRTSNQAAVDVFAGKQIRGVVWLDAAAIQNPDPAGYCIIVCGQLRPDYA
jgi:hypothetical protein